MDPRLSKLRTRIGWAIAIALFLGVIWRFWIWYFVGVAVVGGFLLLAYREPRPKSSASGLQMGLRAAEG